MTPNRTRNIGNITISTIVMLLFAVSVVGIGGVLRVARAADDSICCKAGDETPPLELVKKVRLDSCIVPIRITPSWPRTTRIWSSSSVCLAATSVTAAPAAAASSRP